MFELCPGNRLHVIWTFILHLVWANWFWFFRIQLTFWNKYLVPGPKNNMDFHSGRKVWYNKGKESINYRGFLFWDIQKLNPKMKLKKKTIQRDFITLPLELRSQEWQYWHRQSVLEMYKSVPPQTCIRICVSVRSLGLWGYDSLRSPVLEFV